MEDTRTPYEVSRDNLLANLRPDGTPLPTIEHKGKQFPTFNCNATFGQCGPEARSFGKGSKSDHPHVCAAGKGHDSKLHTCGCCGAIGAVIEPLRGSKARREYTALAKMKQDADRRIPDSGIKDDMRTLMMEN